MLFGSVHSKKKKKKSDTCYRRSMASTSKNVLRSNNEDLNFRGSKNQKECRPPLKIIETNISGNNAQSGMETLKNCASGQSDLGKNIVSKKFDYRSSIRAFVASLGNDSEKSNVQKVVEEVKLNSGYILPAPVPEAVVTENMATASNKRLLRRRARLLVEQLTPALQAVTIQRQKETMEQARGTGCNAKRKAGLMVYTDTTTGIYPRTLFHFLFSSASSNISPPFTSKGLEVSVEEYSQRYNKFIQQKRRRRSVRTLSPYVIIHLSLKVRFLTYIFDF
jgi:hypothetical protein